MLREEERRMIKDKQQNQLSARKTALLTGYDKETVGKYYKMDSTDLILYQGNYNRNSQFTVAIPFITHLIEVHGKISNVKLHERVLEAFPELTGKPRAFNDFMSQHKSLFYPTRSRQYSPVITDRELGQMQVDPGEATIVLDDLTKMKVYFVAFVFDYSRHKFVYFQDRPFATEDFIQAFMTMFCYYGHIPKRCVFDQTKLVVLRELYMECEFNKMFFQFATKHNIKLKVCHKNDPQSKGKVENVVGYIKNNFLNGSEFKDLTDVRERSLEWLNTKANFQAHSTLKIPPKDLFQEEKPYLPPFIPVNLPNEQRKSDKTSLISFEGIKYSVPCRYQEKSVLVSRENDVLHIFDIESKEEVATHNIPLVKGKPVIDPAHFISDEYRIQKRSEEILNSMKGIDFAETLIQKIISDNPERIHAQLFGLRVLANNTSSSVWMVAKDSIFALPLLTVSALKSLLNASQQSIINIYKENINIVSCKSKLDRNLAVYDKVVKNAPTN